MKFKLVSLAESATEETVDVDVRVRSGTRSVPVEAYSYEARFLVANDEKSPVIGQLTLKFGWSIIMHVGDWYTFDQIEGML